MYLLVVRADTSTMRRTLTFLGLIGVVTAAGVAAARRTLPGPRPAVHPFPVHPLPSVSEELRHALYRFEERFGA